MIIKNIFENIPGKIPEEIFEEIISSQNIRIERIISKGQFSPENFWYDQDENEWVFLVRGKAVIKFFDENKPVELKTGDYLNIPSHTKHRVEWTDPDVETIWLAVFY
jgi:cupin 2 domain-containing protein